MDISNVLNTPNKENSIRLDTILLGIYFLFLPLDFIGSDFGAITKLIAILPVGFTLLCNVIRNMKINAYLLLLFCAYWVLNYTSTLYAINPYITEDRSFTLLLNYLMIIICCSVPKNKSEIVFLEKMMVGSSFIITILIIFFADHSINGRLRIRFNSDYQDPNYLCGYMVFTILYFMRNIFEKRNISRSIVTLMVLLVAVLMTGSRGGLIAIIIAAFTYFITYSKNRFSTRFFVFSFLLLIAVIAAILFIPEDILIRYTPSFTRDDGGAGRFDIWGDLINKFKNYSFVQQWFGVGAANIRYISLDTKVAHNLWIEALLELGIFGWLLLILIYSFFIIKSFRYKDKLYFSTLIGYLVMTMSMSLYAYKPIFAIFMFINMVRYDIVDESDDNYISINKM